jgi:hypothetical protein
MPKTCPAFGTLSCVTEADLDALAGDLDATGAMGITAVTAGLCRLVHLGLP